MQKEKRVKTETEKPISDRLRRSRTVPGSFKVINGQGQTVYIFHKLEYKVRPNNRVEWILSGGATKQDMINDSKCLAIEGDASDGPFLIMYEIDSIFREPANRRITITEQRVSMEHIKFLLPVNVNELRR